MKKKAPIAPDLVRLVYCPECRMKNIDLERAFEDLFRCKNCNQKYKVKRVVREYDASDDNIFTLNQEDGYEITKFEEPKEEIQTEGFSISEWISD